MPTLRPIVTWLSRTITKTVTSKSIGSSRSTASYGREESKHLEELGLQALRSPPATYSPNGTHTPNKTLGTVARVEAPAYDRTKKDRQYDEYWPLESDRDIV